MASTAVRSKAVVLSWLIYCFIVLYTSHCLWDYCVGLCFGYALFCVIFSFAIILMRNRELIALLFLPVCPVTVNFLWLFFTVPWVGLKCVIVVCPDCTHLLVKDEHCRHLCYLSVTFRRFRQECFFLVLPWIFN